MSWLCYLRKPAHLPRVSASLRLGLVGWPRATRLSSQSWELPPEALRVAQPNFSSTPAASRKLGTLRQTIPANLSFCSCLIDSFASHVLVQMAQRGGGGRENHAIVEIPSLGDKRNLMWWKPGEKERERGRSEDGGSRLPTAELVPRLQGQASRSLQPRQWNRTTYPYISVY